MLIGTCKGETVHCFSIGGKRYCVRRGSVFVAAWDKRTDVVAVLAPAGMSYHQAALEAAARMERSEYI